MDPIKILLADDKAEFLNTLCQRFTQLGFLVSTAATGREVVRAIKGDRTIEVVILDVHMPSPDGMRTLEIIKKDFPLIEVIMLTGRESIRGAVAAMKAGAFHYLGKPCDIEELVERTRAAAARKRQKEARILDIRMIPYISDHRRAELIAEIVHRK